MKNINLILVTCGIALATGCSNSDHAFRVTSSSFSQALTPPGVPPEPGLPADGDLPGPPAGDTYETTGVVIADGNGNIVINNASPLPNRIDLNSRDLARHESPTAVVIRFDSRRTGDSQIPATHFRVFDDEGNQGAFFTISNGNFWMPGTNGIAEFPSSGGTVPFDGKSLHSVTIQMNFTSQEPDGRLTIAQGGLDASIDFEIPDDFGIARTLRIEFGENGPGGGQTSHVIIPPISATYVEQE